MARAVPAPAAPADPFIVAMTQPDPHPEMQAPAGAVPPHDPALASMQPVLSAVRPPAPLDVPITDQEVLTSLDAALLARSRGDMQGALEALRAALRRLPEHPRLLYQMAQTWDMMVLPQKAEPFWRALHRLGKGAGTFHVLATERLAEGFQQTNEPEEPKEGKFTIKSLYDEEVSDDVQGQLVRFTAVLEKHGTDEVDVEKDMILAIHFFDTVNGRRLARSQVQQPELTCTSLPLNWADGPETFTFEYWQPAMSPAQLVKFGRCRYYGCTLEVYFKNNLQDARATTPELLQSARELPLPAPPPPDSLLDSALPPGAEPSLFPPAPLR
jgi:hypothetical protein